MKTQSGFHYGRPCHPGSFLHQFVSVVLNLFPEVQNSTHTGLGKNSFVVDPVLGVPANLSHICCRFAFQKPKINKLGTIRRERELLLLL